jgi:hypothetical protein
MTAIIRVVLDTISGPPSESDNFLAGLKETGYIEKQNVLVEFRWANNDVDLLPALAGGACTYSMTLSADKSPKLHIKRRARGHREGRSPLWQGASK